MLGWPGHSFTHLSRIVSIFRSAVRHCLNISCRITLIAVSAIANHFPIAIFIHARFPPRSISYPLPLPPAPPPPQPAGCIGRALFRSRAIIFFPLSFFSLLFSSSPPPHFFYLSHKQRSKLRATLRCAHRVIYGWSCSPSGLSINYGQFSSLAFIYAVSNVCACARCIAVV